MYDIKFDAIIKYIDVTFREPNCYNPAETIVDQTIYYLGFSRDFTDILLMALLA